MGVVLRAGKETKAKSELGKALKAMKSLSSSILAMSNAELEGRLLPEMRINPTMEIKDDLYVRRKPHFIDEDEDEIPPEEIIEDAPEGLSIETGEGIDNEGRDFQPAEDLFHFAGRKLSEEFDSEDDRKIRDTIAGLLDNWRSGTWHPDPSALAALEVEFREEIRNWFTQLLAEMPNGFSKPKSEPSAPDIIFQVRETEKGPHIEFEIKLGFLGHCRPTSSVRDRKRPDFKLERTVSFSPEQLEQLIAGRNVALSLLAEFLIEKQAAFITSPDLATAVRRLRSIEQKEFAAFMHGMEKGYGPSAKKDLNIYRSLASRIVSNKSVQVPFENTPIPAKFFFDEFVGRINVLKTAIEVCVRHQYPKLFSPDQSVVLKALCKGQSCDERNIRRHLWPRLQMIYFGSELTADSPKEDKRLAREIGILGKAGTPPGSEKISDAVLFALINEVGEELGIPGLLSQNDVELLREQPAPKRIGKTVKA